VSAGLHDLDSDDQRCLSCGAEVDHYLGCADDPNPDYEAEAEATWARELDCPAETED
jgi:hypothetical protein